MEKNIDRVSKKQKLKKGSAENNRNFYNLQSPFNTGCQEMGRIDPPFFYLKSIMPIQRGEINLITGKSGIGKSYIGLYILLSIQKELLQHNQKVFGFFSDDSLKTTVSRTIRLKRIHMSLTHIDIVGEKSETRTLVDEDDDGVLFDTEYFGQLKKHLEKYEVILLDPILRFFKFDESSGYQIRFLMDSLKHWCGEANKTLIITMSKESLINERMSAVLDTVSMHYNVTREMDSNGTYINKDKRIVTLAKGNHYGGKSKKRITLFEPEVTT